MMAEPGAGVIGGVDTHPEVHVGAALCAATQQLLGVESFPATECGYEQLLAWLQAFGTVERVGVEGTGSDGAGQSKEVAVQGSPDRRWIVCHNPAEAERDAARRQQTLERLEAEFAAIDAARARTVNKQPGKHKADEEAGHTRAEEALRDNPALGRYLRLLKSGRLRIDRGKVNREARLDGTYLISTSDPDLTAAEAAIAYNNLLEVERGFRDLKSTLELRPTSHRLAHRIRAPVLICWVARLLTCVAERYTGPTWRQINTELSRLQQGNETCQVGRNMHTTPLTAA